MRIVSLALVCAVLSSIAFAADPGSQVAFTNLPALNSKDNKGWGAVLKDIMNHEAPNDKNRYSDLITLGHETTHGIQAYLRNHKNKTGKKANAFYVLEDRAVFVVEPKIRKSKVAKYVPKTLRGFRFATYVTGQTAWDDTPLYIWDEWNAYVNGGSVGVDQVQRNLWKGSWQDGVAGQLEFAVYALATAMAVHDLDPTYFKEETQFTEFLAWNLKRTMETYALGAVMKEFKWDTQDKYLDKLRNVPEAEAMRTFARDLFGGSWTKSVFDF